MNEKLLLPTEIVCNLSVSDNGVLAAVVLSCYARNSGTIEIVSVRPTIELLCGDYERVMADRLRAGINELADCGHIKVLKTSSRDSYILDLENFIARRNKYYIYMDYGELQKIIRMKQETNRAALLRCFVTIIGHMNVAKKTPKKYRGKVCTISREAQADMCGKSLPTYRKLVRLLESENMIYIVNSTRGAEKSNDCTSRSSDRELCIEYCRTVGKDMDNAKEEVANERRKYKQIYNQLLKGNYNYSHEVVRLVKKYVDEANENGEDLDIRPFDHYYKANVP